MKSLFARKPPEPVQRKVNLADPERLAALKRLKVMDTPPEESLDRLTRIAAKVVGAPVALLTLIDSHRQFFKSAFGLPEPLNTTRETPLTYSFCRHVVEDSAPMIVGDALLDPRLRDNPAIEVVGVRAYAGMPLYAPNGEPLGSFCVMDTRPREWTPDQMGVLKDLAASVMAELEAREISHLLVRQEETRIDMGEEITDDVMVLVRGLIGNLKGAMAAKTVGPALTSAIVSAERIGARLHDLGDVASFSPDTIYMTLRRHDLGKIMTDAAKELADLAAELQVKFDISVPKELPLVLVHEPSMQRVLRILLRQAMRFTDPCGTVKMWAREEDNVVACYISNVSSTAEENIHDAWKERQSGSEAPRTNIGLAFCERTLEEHGGTIGVATTGDGKPAMRLTLSHLRMALRP
jgi:signal transduction histidine kinase